VTAEKKWVHTQQMTEHDWVSIARKMFRKLGAGFKILKRLKIQHFWILQHLV
jgi:hypothetical protein